MLTALKNLQPAKKYFVTMFFVSCLLLGAFTLVIYQQSKVNEQSTRWVIHSYEVLHRAHNLLIHMYDSDTAAQNYMALDAARFLATYHESVAKIDLDLDALTELTADNPRQQGEAVGLRSALEQFKTATASEISAFGTNHDTSHNLAARSLAHINIMDEVRTRIRVFNQSEFSLLNSRIDMARAQQKNYLLTLFFGAVLGLGALVIANLVIFGLVTPSGEVEEELRRSEERFRFVMSGINDGIFDRDLTAGTVYFSPGCKTMLGYTDEEFPSTPEAFKSLLHPDDEPQVWETMRRYAEHEIPTYSSLFRMRHKDGGWRWILSRGVGVWDKEGSLQRLVGTRTDMTTQKEREEELEQLNADLEGFTYIASHDLRAPLVNLKGFSIEIQQSLAQAKRLLGRTLPEMPSDEQAALAQIFEKDIPEAVGFIQSSVEKMDELTGAILDLSRIGRREFHMREVDTGILMRRCLDALAYEISSRKIEVECGALPSVVSDSVALEQVFGNILDNAVKYLDPMRSGKIEINAIGLSTETIFSIRDNGRGIGEQDEKKVFDIFRRAGNIGHIRGAGIGMAYVKATLRKLGGRIWFQSRPDIGTVFYVSLPSVIERREAA